MDVNYGRVQFDGAGCELMVNERCDWMWGWRSVGVEVSGGHMSGGVEVSRSGGQCGMEVSGGGG